MIADEWAKAGQELGKAGQEIGKATGKGFDAAQSAGGFFGRYLDGPLEQASNLITDRLRYARWEQQVRLGRRAQELLRAQGLDAPTRQIPLSIGVPLIEAGSLEGDPSLQELWAQLLATGADLQRPEIRKGFVSILGELTARDAQILIKIVRAPEEYKERGNLNPAGLPELYLERDTETTGMPLSTEISLWNLVRLGCIAPATGWTGPSILSVSATPLGNAFVDAVSAP